MGTYFAPAGRTSAAELHAEIEIVSRSPVTVGLLHTVGGLLAILDEHRQIVALNDSFLNMLGITDPGESLGLRLGEALQCNYAHDEPDGCGTTRYCQNCGAAIAMVSSLEQGQAVERICALTATKDGVPLELALLVRGCPVQIESRRFLLIFVQDVTVHEQRAALERTFFHDIANLLNGLVGASEILALESPDTDLAQIIHEASMRLVREVEIQRCLLRAERGSYVVEAKRVEASALLSELQSFFVGHAAVAGKSLAIREPAPGLALQTDLSLLLRVLCNMVTNALEATAMGGVVRLWTEPNREAISFCVWNETAIPPDVALRVFGRNFSTKKGEGRGIGTYSMKLFGERMLGGKVDFTSSPQAGTVFRIALPV